jgi:hypothetical protein
MKLHKKKLTKFGIFFSILLCISVYVLGIIIIYNNIFKEYPAKMLFILVFWIILPMIIFIIVTLLCYAFSD